MSRTNIRTNTNSIDLRVDFVGSDLIPNQTNTWSLGNSSSYFNEAYINNLTVNKETTVTSETTKAAWVGNGVGNTADLLSEGLYFTYNTSTYAGIGRNANDGGFYIFHGYGTTPDGSTDLSKLSLDNFNANKLNATATTNQLTLGTTKTYTISATAPSASRVLTISDPLTNANVLLSEGSQTINGSNTFSSTLLTKDISLNNGSTRTISIPATTSAVSMSILGCDQSSANGNGGNISILSGASGITTGNAGTVTIDTGSRFNGTGTFNIAPNNASTISLGNGTTDTTNLKSTTINLTNQTASSMIYLNSSNKLICTAATNGQILIGKTGSDPVIATLTGTSNQVVVTNGSGTITLSTPQDIATTSSPTFSNLTLTGTSLLTGPGNTAFTIKPSDTSSSPLPFKIQGSVNSNGANGTDIYLDAGYSTGGGQEGSILIGSSKTRGIQVGRTGIVTGIYGTVNLPSTSANSVLYSDSSMNVKSLVLTNGQIVIGSTGAAPVAAAITGTSNQITVTNGTGSITLSTPQNIDTAANVTFGTELVNTLSLFGAATGAEGTYYGFTTNANTVVYYVSGNTSGFSHSFRNSAKTELFNVNATGYITVPATSSQIVLGTTKTITLTAPTPSASRIYTIPDSGKDASFVMTEKATTQTINSALVVTKNVEIDNATFTVVNNSPFTVFSIDASSTNKKLTSSATTNVFDGITAKSVLTLDASNVLKANVMGDGELLIGNTGGVPLVAQLTGTADQINITNGSGEITLSTPQDIGTSSNVSFNTVHSLDITDSGGPTTGSMICDGGMGIARSLHLGQALFLPTSGGTATGLNYYEETTHTSDFKFATGGKTITGITINITRIGNIVTISVPNILVTSLTATGVLEAQTKMPSRFIPTNTTRAYSNVSDNGIQSNGIAFINTSTSLTFTLATGAGFLGGVGGSSGCEASSFSYLMV